MSLQLNGTDGVTFNDGSEQGAAASPIGTKNLIINGDMRIDQRNAGASVSLPSSTVVYPSDRFYFYFQMGASGVTIQRVSDAPTDFQYSSKITVGTGDTATASEVALFRQLIEGNNVAHLKCGTSDAKTVTLSFWVKSSLTGIYGIGVRNSASNRNYVMTYSISSANTWEKKTLTFTNDTAGTWLTDNGIGLTVTWDLGSGSNWQTATPETWDTAGKFTTSSQANLIGTSGATWQITGVQLEVGDTATPFEVMPYDMNLARCQRYFISAGNCMVGNGLNDFAAACFPVTMRASPTVTTTTATTLDAVSTSGFLTKFGGIAGSGYTADSEL